MNVIHLSAECYPVAKVGGLGDVVGALPKYLCRAGLNAAVVMPYYDRSFTRENEFDTIYEGTGLLGSREFNFSILKESSGKLGFNLFLVRVPGLLDREEVYAYPDETEQFVTFQLAVLDWLVQTRVKPDIIHCHDHHTGLVPFLVSHSSRYTSLAAIPTICTIHNAQYQGWFGWDKLSYLPGITPADTGLLDWSGCINPLAAAVKCCWKFTTVSPSYLADLSLYANGLEYLFAAERQKGSGIINGIDTQVWNPKTDAMIAKTYTSRWVSKGKLGNKQLLAESFGLDSSKPLLVFIGRLVGEKGADLLPEVIVRSFDKHQDGINIIMLGSGEPHIEEQLRQLAEPYRGKYHVHIGYDEALAHKIYAAADFLLMPSRVEPCGLNQLYSLRYGTMPIVSSTGGLKDTVIDLELPGGYGIRFEEAAVNSICQAIDRAADLFQNTARLDLLRKQMMALDFSWDQSANQYIKLYNSLNSQLI